MRGWLLRITYIKNKAGAGITGKKTVQFAVGYKILCLIRKCQLFNEQNKTIRGKLIIDAIQETVRVCSTNYWHTKTYCNARAIAAHTQSQLPSFQSRDITGSKAALI